MGNRKLAVIHADRGIPWHGAWADALRSGLRKIGWETVETTSRVRQREGVPVLLGTTLWKEIQQTYGWLILDRAFFGDPDYARFAWNGNDHRVPAGYGPERFAEMGFELESRPKGSRHILCGQDQSTTDADLADYYRHTCSKFPITHFKPHPAIPGNPTVHPTTQTLDDAHTIYTYSSTVAFEAIMKGIDVIVADEKHPMNIMQMNRQKLFEFLAWTQYNLQEVSDGDSIEHLFNTGI